MKRGSIISLSKKQFYALLVYLTAMLSIQLAVAIFIIGTLNSSAAQVPAPIWTNSIIRVMSANLTGDSQTYGQASIRIFQGLKPDIIAIQEFNYSDNTYDDIKGFINLAFGTNFFYFRETNSNYSLPNGIISRYPILLAGSFDDIEIPDRGFVYAVIDIPGDKNLVVFSVHLKAGSDSASRRATEALQLKNLIASNFSTQSNYIIVAGDFNLYSTNESAYRTIISFLNDFPIPEDTERNPNTNLNRNQRYDYIFTSVDLTSLVVPVQIGRQYFTNGLVFDSRSYSPLSDVKPVLPADSSMAQHLAVIKDFSISYRVTNFVNIESPVIEIDKTGLIKWRGASNITYSIYSSSNLLIWNKLGIATSSGNLYYFVCNPFTNKIQFFRVGYP
ncbi:MAG: endonuclease/exonuclease/phosphatase family protein [Verrucomicrobiia bacterium]